MQLVENGKLNLTNLFQNIWITKTWQNITVKQIVTHKSGLLKFGIHKEICYLKTVKLFIPKK
jgi:CubicO group peptidase (beta-lactamase class C family)